MLHKRFKPAKCKTSLKLATSRIKLMKNKKGVQINQMKKDLAQLLETGQDRTARIRVEHVIREEKMVGAYELIEIYCELIVARLAIIESQKTCPVDLKEAVTSVIFAAPRCSDITELSDIKKHFTAKYGKEFVSAAIELRPDCGVSRMLVEKLSAIAPDLQTKLKVLSVAAKEHNIDWDPTSFEEKESKPPSDLLNGPANFEKASMANADPPKIQPSSINDVHSHEDKPNVPYDFSQQNKKYTLGTQNITSSDNGVQTSSAATHSGDNSERMEFNDYSSGRQNWNMEFQDATSAAQAAAESAERAAIAARAAAQFSSQENISKQYPNGPHESNFRDKTPHVYAPSGSSSEGQSIDDRKPKIPKQHIDRSEHDTSPKATERFDGPSHGGYFKSNEDEKLVNNIHVADHSIDDRKPEILNQHIDRSEHVTSPKATERFDGPSHGGYFKSKDDEKLVNNIHVADGYFVESLNDDQEGGPSSHEMTNVEGFRESKNELGSFESENINYFAEESTKKQPSMLSSHSHSHPHPIYSSEELEVHDHQEVGKTSVVGNPFAVVDQVNVFREPTMTSSNVDAISDDETGPRFDTGVDYDEAEALENAHIWSPRRNMSNTVDQTSSQSHLFSESLSFNEHSVKSAEPSETEDHVPASFDHSDGPDSESESEKKELTYQDFNSRKNRIELNDLVEDGESSFNNHEDEEKRQESQQSSSSLLSGHELKKYNLDLEESYDTLEDNNDSLNQSNDLDTGKELNFGTLTGGLRNKGGFRYPPYTKSAETNVSNLSKKSLNLRESRMEDKKTSVSESSSDSDSDDYSNDKFPVQSSEKASKQKTTRLHFSAPDAFFNDDGADSEDVIPKPVPSRVRLGSGLSRRTRGPPSASKSKSHVDPEPKTVISSQYSYSDEIPAEPRSYARRFKEEDAKQIPDSQQPVNPSRKTTEIDSTKPINTRIAVESGKTKTAKTQNYSDEIPAEPRSYARRFKEEDAKQVPESQQPVNPSRKTTEIDSTKPVNTRIAVESGNTKTGKTQNLGSEKMSGENLVKKASHVHPKLPDYDSLAARLQSLRKDHQ